MNHTIMLMLRDALRLPSGAVAEAPYTILVYCRVPEDWVEGEIPAGATGPWLKGPTLRSDRLEQILGKLYGPAWRSGNADGSAYVVLGHGMRLLNPALGNERPWQHDDPANPKMRYHHYAVDQRGDLAAVPAAEF